MSRKNRRRQDNRESARYVNRHSAPLNTINDISLVLDEVCKDIGVPEDSRRPANGGPGVVARLKLSYTNRAKNMRPRWVISVRKGILPEEVIKNVNIRYTPAIKKLKDEHYLIIKYGHNEQYQNTMKQGQDYGKLYIQTTSDEINEYFGIFKYEKSLEYQWKEPPVYGSTAIAFPMSKAICVENAER